MEKRGNRIEKNRQSVSRRSCDQCRTRKIRCDRSSPCSNCISARVECTHSSVSSNTGASKQRVLISAQYEQKIDAIARDLDGIKSLLEKLPKGVEGSRSAPETPYHKISEPVTSIGDVQKDFAPPPRRTWDHSTHMVDFIKSVVADAGHRNDGSEASKVVASLKKLTQKLERTKAAPELILSAEPVTDSPQKGSLPPLDAVVNVLRWAKNHSTNSRISWIADVLPLQKWSNICQKVFFAVDEYGDVEWILANGYLSYVFFEHIVVTGRAEYRDHCCLCRANMYAALGKLPLLLPASMEMVAALVLGVHATIEESRASIAWTWCSAAASLCLTLGYHQWSTAKRSASPLETNLFWTVYKMDKALAVRLSISPVLRRSDITLPFDENASRSIRFAAIQEQVYNDLCSSAALKRPRGELAVAATALVSKLKSLINETSSETQPSSQDVDDPMRISYVQSDMVLQMSLLCQVLRVVPGNGDSVSHECIAIARKTLEIHQQCIETTRSCVTNCYVITRYINWTITNSPFAPFSILFKRAVQLRDEAELARLEKFARSLQPEKSSMDIDTHPYQLYQLLCQAARLYLRSSADATQSSMMDNSGLSHADFSGVDFDMNDAVSWDLNTVYGNDADGLLELRNWFGDNQLMMGLLEDHVGMFSPSLLLPSAG